MLSSPLRRLALVARPDPPADPQLVRAFLLSRDEDAFAELVRRHGPMVLAACRRVLGHREDAEDAFQAAFLVLARKAGSVRGANLAGWLYAVAVRTARGVRLMRDRRRARDEASRRREPAVPVPDDAHGALEIAELAAIVDEVLAGLPEHYRLPVVLCELQGRSRKAAAAELGIPEGTLSSRLAAARRKLADRLTERGVTAPAAGLAAVLVPAAGPVAAGLARAAVRAAVADGVASAVAAEAAAGVVKGLLVARLKAGAVAVAVAAGFVGGIVVATVPGGVVAGDADVAPPPRAVVDPAALAGQLGADDFAAREAAAKQLRALGPKAVPALTAATRAANPEVARRAADLLKAIRGDARAALAESFDPAGTADYDHPVWTRFKGIVGDDRPARELFAAIIGDADGLRLLDDAAADPDRAGDLYQRAGERLYEKYKARLDPPNTGRVDLSILPVPEAATIVYLGTYPSSTGKGDPWWAPHRILLHPTAKEVPPGWRPDRAARRLYVAWLARRDREHVLTDGLQRAAAWGLEEVLPLARAVAADKGRPAKVRCAALPVLIRLGSKADLPAFEAVFDDERVIHTFRLTGSIPVGSKIDGTGAVQARDYALGMALLLHGHDPAEHGFYVAEKRRQVLGGKADLSRYDPFHLGFMTGDDEGRPAAHRRARAALAGPPAVAPGDPAEQVRAVLAPLAGYDTNVAAFLARGTFSPEERAAVDRTLAGNWEALREVTLARLGQIGPAARPALAEAAKGDDARVAAVAADALRALDAAARPKGRGWLGGRK